MAAQKQTHFGCAQRRRRAPRSVWRGANTMSCYTWPGASMRTCMACIPSQTGSGMYMCAGHNRVLVGAQVNEAQCAQCGVDSMHGGKAALGSRQRRCLATGGGLQRKRCCCARRACCACCGVAGANGRRAGCTRTRKRMPRRMHAPRCCGGRRGAACAGRRRHHAATHMGAKLWRARAGRRRAVGQAPTPKSQPKSEPRLSGRHALYSGKAVLRTHLWPGPQCTSASQ